MGRAQVIQRSGLPKSRLARLAVGLVVLWSLINVAASGYFAAIHQPEVTHRTPFAAVMSVVIASLTTVAYAVVVMRAPSTGRWLWAAVIATLLFAAPVSAAGQIGQHVFSALDVVMAALVGLTISGPLVWFYLHRP